MPKLETVRQDWYRGTARVLALGISLILLIPFVALALLPMLLFLVPVAIVGLPFIVPAFVSGTLATRDEAKRLHARAPRLSVVRIAR